MARVALAPHRGVASTCFLPAHQESKANLSRATKAKRELRLHLANLPKVVAAIESLDALPQDFDLDIGDFDDDGDAKRSRLG